VINFWNDNEPSDDFNPIFSSMSNSLTNVVFASIKGAFLGEEKIEDITSYPTIVLYKNGKKIEVLLEAGEA